jgi:monofunctional biosynthetic peptidoglycan transglycosylase
LRRNNQSIRYRQPEKKLSQTSSLSKRLVRVMTHFALGLLVISILLVGLLRFVPVYTSAFMWHTHIDDLVENKAYRPIQQTWVNSQHISKSAFNAVIASEDQRFYIHHGFDIAAIYQAYQKYQQGGKLRGASTISQQVAKNLFLSPAKNIPRKVLEVWFTFWIECLWSKARILEVYLNIAQFGDHLFGIEAASQQYFGIPAKRLSASQSALLAATLPNPLLLKAAKPSAYLLRRQHWILRQMHNLGG